MCAQQGEPMDGFNLDIASIKDYEEMLIPAGKYLVEILEGKDEETQKGRGKLGLRAKIIDTIPAGEDIDLDAFLDPIDSLIFPNIYLPMEGDVSRTKNMMTKILQGYLVHFEVEAGTPGVLTAKDFIGCSGGIVVKHERMDKDDPSSDLRVNIKSACAID